jgi:proteasome lid subunit RPN8/RPN11
VVISSEFIDRMIEHARVAFPNEACGLLATDGSKVTAFYPIVNADASPVHYRMDPQEQLRAMLDIEDHGWDVGAIFHSHTRTRAYPSPTDVGLAFYPDAAYVIVSLARADAPEVRAYSIVDGVINSRELEIVDG